MGKLQVLKKLGQGTYGTVYLVTDSADGEQFVMKRIRVKGMLESELLDCRKEIEILQMLNHKNVIRYRRSFIAKDSLCIVMDYAERGDLYHIAKKRRKQKRLFSEDRVLRWFTQACLGIKHIHDSKIMHRDLKTKNIFLTEDHTVKIGDFGISRVLGTNSEYSNSFVGAPYYMSPEMLKGEMYNNKTDIWSMGVVLYELLTLKHPFVANDLESLAATIIEGKYGPIPDRYCAACSELLKHMLERDVEKRYSIDDVLDFPIIKEYVEKLELTDGSFDDLKYAESSEFEFSNDLEPTSPLSISDD